MSKPIAQSLPFDILFRIFVEFSKSVHVTNCEWGGVLYRWSSNNDQVRLLISVCRNWRLPAEIVLYQTVSILSSREAECFLKTSRVRPELIEKVRFLVVGLSEKDTWPSSDEDLVGGGIVEERRMSISKGTQASTSLAMISVIQVCPNLKHLQIRPLHQSVRSSLLKVIESQTSLESLICAPRLRKAEVSWTGCLWSKFDLSRLALPTLKNLEVDAWTCDELLVDSENDRPLFLSNQLKTLRLRFDTTDEDLFSLMKVAGPTLEQADIYVERSMDPELTSEALSYSISTLRELRWTTNPPTVEGAPAVEIVVLPTFDRILSQFKVLEKAQITATDISSSLLLFLPNCLRDLEIRSLSYSGAFRFHSNMLKTLAIPTVKSKNNIKFYLENFTVYDSRELWSIENVVLMDAACLSRVSGFIF